MCVPCGAATPSTTPVSHSGSRTDARAPAADARSTERKLFRGSTNTVLYAMSTNRKYICNTEVARTVSYVLQNTSAQVPTDISNISDFI